LALAKYASSLAFLLTVGWVGALFFFAIWNYENNVGRIVLECFLAALSFLGLFWNSYFLVSSIMKCFIPAKAFQTNTKYCSIIPETKPPEADWLDVTIQIPVYKECKFRLIAFIIRVDYVEGCKTDNCFLMCVT
jgi:hypothetical protein